VVAIGTFDGRLFQARQVLTKCPSKYEGQDPAQHDVSMGRTAGQGDPRRP